MSDDTQPAESTEDTTDTTEEANEDAAEQGDSEEVTTEEEEDPYANEVPTEKLIELRELMHKLVIVKNSYLDSLCNNDELFEKNSLDGSKVEIYGELIDFIVVRHLLSEVNLGQNSNLDLFSKDNRVKISIPVEHVLQ